MTRFFKGRKLRSLRNEEPPRAFLSASEVTTQALGSRLFETSVVVFDIETTGGNPDRNGITEISALRYYKGEVVDKFYSLVNPQVPIPGIVRRMTGITNKMVKDAPLIDEVMPKIINFIGSDVLVSHNTIGDLRFLRHFAAEVAAHNLDNFFLCTHLLSERLIPEAKDKSLKGLAQSLGFAIDENHRAEADAIMTLELFKVLLSRLDTQRIHSLEQAIRFQGDTESAIRLGWGIDPSELEGLPRNPGVFYLYDHNQQLLFFSSSHNIQRDILSLKQFHALPKHLMKVVLRAQFVKFKIHSNFFSAFLDESRDPRRNKVAYQPIKFHMRLIQSFAIDREGNSYRISIQSSSNGTQQVFGRVSDHRQGHILLDNLSVIFNSEMTKRGFLISEKDLPFVESFFRGRLDSLEAKLTEGPLATMKNFLSGQKTELLKMRFKQLRELNKPSDLEPLLARNGLIVAQCSQQWQFYPVVHGRPLEPIQVPADPEQWLKSPEGRSIFARLEEKEGLPPPPVTLEDEGVVNAVIWALASSPGKSRDVLRFIGIPEMREIIFDQLPL